MSDYNLKVSDTGHKHPFHVPDPSPWPLIGSISAIMAAVGAATFFHGGTWLILAFGLIGILATMYFWWRDVIREATVQKAHSPIVKISMRYGMLLFIMSEIMFFAAFFWAFFDASLYPDLAIGGIWPPPSIHPVEAFGLPFMMTMILLLSGCAVTWGHHALLEGHNDELIRALLITVLLGVVFTGFQAYEYIHAHFGFTDTIFASTFFMATGFHGFHVLVGTIFLFVCWCRARKGHFEPDDHFGFEAAAWYWHFVDVVWLFLFVAVYWFGG